MALPNISELKALSIRQPWASLFFLTDWADWTDGLKDVENRSWPTKFRGQFLIHAGKQIDKDAIEYEDCIGPRGGIIGIGEIWDCVTASKSIWFHGPYGFLVRNTIELPLIPCKGALSFFTPDLKRGICALWHEGTLSEGQCCALLNMGRVEFRKMAYDDYPKEGKKKAGHLLDGEVIQQYPGDV